MAAGANLRLPVGARLVLQEQVVQKGLDRLAAELQPLVDAEDCVLLAIMNGGSYPLQQLATRLRGDFLMEYCHATRYLEKTMGGELQWLRRPPDSIRGRTVLLIDDIYDAGLTLNEVAAACSAAGADSVHTVVEVVKERQREASLREPDFSTGLTVPDVYVFGCGMDLAGRWRHLPSIYGWYPEG